MEIFVSDIKIRSSSLKKDNNGFQYFNMVFEYTIKATNHKRVRSMNTFFKNGVVYTVNFIFDPDSFNKANVIIDEFVNDFKVLSYGDH